MTRSKTLPDPPAHADLFGATQNAPQSEPCSHTTPQRAPETVLHTMSRAFRRADDCRTLAWMALEGIGDDVTPGEVRKRLVRWVESAQKALEEYDAAQG